MNEEICHYKATPTLINISTMFRQDLTQLSIFQGLSQEQMAVLTPLLAECHYAPHEVIFEQGRFADDLYILIEGEVVVWYKPYDGPALVVARIKPGGVCGWSAALGRDVYTSSAVTETESVLIRVSGTNLRQLCEQHPDTGAIVLEHLASVITERLQTTHADVLTILTQGMDLNDTVARRSKNGGK